MCLKYTGTYDHPVMTGDNHHPVVTGDNVHPVVTGDYVHPVVASPLQSLPHIEQYHGVNQTVQQGDTVYIGCKVYNVGNR